MILVVGWQEGYLAHKKNPISLISKGSPSEKVEQVDPRGN